MNTLIASSAVFLSSLFVVTAALIICAKMPSIGHKAVFITSILYAIFCLVFFARINGYTSAPTPGQIFNQRGVDYAVDLSSFSIMIDIASLCVSAFNIFTAIWILSHGRFGLWCFISIFAFLMFGILVASITQTSCLLVIFLCCCGFMAMFGWVVGLSYIDICVIGNIWIPLLLIVATAAAMLCRLYKNRQTNLTVKALITALGSLEILTSLAIGIRYLFPSRQAFDLCVKDLTTLAHLCGTTYANINLLIYVIAIVTLLTLNVFLIRRLRL